MTPARAQVATISIDNDGRVSALIARPAGASACFVFAHGAGAGMTHPFMEAVSVGLYEVGIASMRFQFPYMENRLRRPDPPPSARPFGQRYREARRLTGGIPLIAGGRSFGGRMTSQAQARAALPDVAGLTFLGFPLHPAGRPSAERAQHLSDVSIPMLFLQGTRDKLAELSLLQPLITGLGARATLKLIEDADHSFHVPARSGRTDSQVLRELIRHGRFGSSRSSAPA